LTQTVHSLLKRAAGSSDDFTDVSYVSKSVTDDHLTFTVDAGNLGSEFTLGATSDSPTAITLREAAVRPGAWGAAVLLLALGGLAAVYVYGWWRRW